MSANNQALKQIKACLQSQNKQSISQSELKTEQTSNKNYWPWILGEVGVIALITWLIWYFMRKENKNK